MPFRGLASLGAGGTPRERGQQQQADQSAGKTDLLVRFFQSQFFDEWIAIT